MKNIFIVCWAITILACKKLDTVRPPCDAQPVSIWQDTSFLSTPLVIPTHLIAEKLNHAVRHDLITDNDFDNRSKGGKKNNTTMTVTRLGPIQVRWKDNVATYDIPLLVLAKRHIIPKRILPLSKSLSIKTEFSLRLVFKTKLDIDKGWKLIPRTQFHSFEWLSEVKVLGGLVDIKKMVERRLHRQMPDILGALDSTIRATIHIDRKMGNVWRKIQKPICINQKDRLVWLKIHPIRFEMGGIKTESDNLLVQFRLYATTETIVGEYPVHEIDSVLPPLVKRPALSDEAFVYLLSEIPYKDINTIISQKLTGLSFDLPLGHQLSVKGAEIWGCGTNLVLRLRVRGDVRGDIYFQGTPVYEPDSQRVIIQNFDFEVRTQEVLMATSDWLLHETFKEQVKNALSIELAEKIVEIPTSIIAGIERGEAGEKIDLTIEHWDFKPQKIWVREDDIATLILVNARVRIELEQL
jgi:hypothetical protein